MSPNHVYVHVHWMYHPSEFPGGRESYHIDDNELIVSNHMEIINTDRIKGRVEVLH